MFTPADLFDLSQTETFGTFRRMRSCLGCAEKNRLPILLQTCVLPLHNRCEGVAYVGQRVFIGEGTVVEDGRDD